MADDSVPNAATQPSAPQPHPPTQPPPPPQTGVAAYAANQMAQTTIMQQQQQQQSRQAALQQHSLQELNSKLNSFWLEQMDEVQHANDFKNHLLPLARIKKIMKSDEDVRMISAEAPVLFAKACEMFILELTHRAWAQTEEAKRRTLQRSDISAAIQKTDIFDFLIDIVPRDEPKKDDVRPVTGGVEQQPLQYYPMANVPNAAAYGMPPQMNTAAVTDSSAAMMYAPNPQQVYASAGYPAGMPYQPGMVNPQYMRMQQQVMYAAPNYPAQYLTGSTAEQQPPPS